MDRIEVCNFIKSRLQAYEDSPPHPTQSLALHEAAKRLACLPSATALDFVLDCLVSYPKAGSSFVGVILYVAPRSSELRVLLVRLLWFYNDPLLNTSPSFVDEVRDFVPILTPELRSVVFLCAPELLDAERYVEGTDYVCLEHRAVRRCTEDRTFPPLDSLEGQRERLRFLGYDSSDLQGERKLADRAVLTLFQLDHNLEPTGAPDEPTCAALDELAWGELYAQVVFLEE